MEIYYHSEFIRQYKKLPFEIKLLVKKKEQIFKKSPFDPQLETHKLHGDFSKFLAFSLNYKYRVVFNFIDKNIVRFYAIGTHDIYK